MKTLIVLETPEQVEWLSTHQVTSGSETSFLAATPAAAFACQRVGLPHEKIEEHSRIRARRAEYTAAVLAEFLDWQAWLDGWARNRIIEFGRAAFNPAECVTFLLQGLHAEVWATSQCASELLGQLRPDEIFLWRPRIDGVPWFLHPSISPVVVLTADAAEHQHLRVRDLGVEQPQLRPVAKSVAEPPGIADAVWRRLKASRFRASAEALRNGQISDVIRGLLPSVRRQKRVLVYGFGYDAQPLVRELRRSSVDVVQVNTGFSHPRSRDTAVFAKIAAAADDLMSEARLWEPVERLGVGRTALWREPLRHWWERVVPEYWQEYSRATHFFEGRPVAAAVFVDVGGGAFGGAAVASAARAAHVPTHIFQHGSSSDVDGKLWQCYFRGVDTFHVYGEGTAADLVETLPAFVHPRASLSVTGSARLDELRRSACLFKRHGKLRKKLQNGDRRPLVLYVPTAFGIYGRAVDYLADYPDVSYFELLQRVVALWSETDRARLVFKEFPATDDATRIIRTFVKERVPSAIVTTIPLTRIMWAVDAIVVDHMITAAAEVLLTDKPCLFYMPSRTSQAERARELLRVSATVASSEDGFVHAIRSLLANCDFAPVIGRDQSFLKAYGTHMGDGLSAKRAAETVSRGVDESSFGFRGAKQ